MIRRNEHTGQLVYSSDYGNTYYRPHPAHIKRKNPLFTPLVFVSSTLYNDLDTATKAVLDSFEFNVILKPRRYICNVIYDNAVTICWNNAISR